MPCVALVVDWPRELPKKVEMTCVDKDVMVVHD